MCVLRARPPRESGALAVVVVLVITVGLASGCVLDPGQKHECQRAQDCLAGRMCVDGTCRAGDAFDAADAHDASGSDAAAMEVAGRDADPEDAPQAGQDTASNDAATADADAAHADAGTDVAADVAKTDGRDADATAGNDAPGAGDSSHAEAGPETSEAGGDARPDGDAPAGDGGSDALYVAAGTPNYMFVTSQTYALDFGTLATVDQYCANAAKAGGLPGTFRAWVSTATVNAGDRIKNARGWIRPDGAPFADTFADLAAGRMFYAPLIDERGHEARSTADGNLVATGTYPDGTGVGGCDGWTTTRTDRSLVSGQSDGGVGRWTSGGALGMGDWCNFPMHFYCFGVDHVTPVSVVPVPGKKAFLSTGYFTTTGLDGADRLCAAEAKQVGLSGTFSALLATTTAPAAKRFPSTPHRWVRLDGVALVWPGQDLFRDPLAAPLDLTSQGTYIDEFVFSGAMTPMVVSPGYVDSCADWEDTGWVETTASVGSSASIDQWFYDVYDIGNDSCSRLGRHVYCLEQ